MSDSVKKYPVLSLFIPSSILSKQTRGLTIGPIRKHRLSLILRNHARMPRVYSGMNGSSGGLGDEVPQYRKILKKPRR